MDEDGQTPVLFFDLILCGFAPELEDIVGVVEFVVEESGEFLIRFDWFPFYVGSQDLSDFLVELLYGLEVHFKRDSIIIDSRGR